MKSDANGKDEQLSLSHTQTYVLICSIGEGNQKKKEEVAFVINAILDLVDGRTSRGGGSG